MDFAIRDGIVEFRDYDGDLVSVSEAGAVLVLTPVDAASICLGRSGARQLARLLRSFADNGDLLDAAKIIGSGERDGDSSGPTPKTPQQVADEMSEKFPVGTRVLFRRAGDRGEKCPFFGIIYRRFAPGENGGPPTVKVVGGYSPQIFVADRVKIDDEGDRVYSAT